MRHIKSYKHIVALHGDHYHIIVENYERVLFPAFAALHQEFYYNFDGLINSAYIIPYCDLYNRINVLLDYRNKQDNLTFVHVADYFQSYIDCQKM